MIVFLLTRLGRLSSLKWPKVAKSVYCWLLRDSYRCCVGTHRLPSTKRDGLRFRPRSAHISKSPGAATSTSRLSRVNPCLIYPLPVWQEIEERLAKLPSLNPTKKKFLDRTNFYGQVTSADKSGRILIPPLLRESAQMTGEVAVLGYLDHLEVWNHKRFFDRIKAAAVHRRRSRNLKQVGNLIDEHACSDIRPSCSTKSCSSWIPNRAADLSTRRWGRRACARNSGAHRAGRPSAGHRSGRIGAGARQGNAAVIWIAGRIRPFEFQGSGDRLRQSTAFMELRRSSGGYRHFIHDGGRSVARIFLHA